MTAPIQQVYLGESQAQVFAPPSLTGLILWWDAQVFASLTIVSGTTVTAVADQSGVGNNGTALNGPVYSATGFNGTKPGIAFTSTSNQGLVNSALAFGTGNTLTLFGVFRMNDPAIDGIGQFARFFSYTASGQTNDFDNNGSFTFARDNSTSNAFFTRNNAGPASAAFGYHTARRLIITVKSDGTEVVYIDRVAVSASETAANFVSPGYFGVAVSQNDSGVFNQYGGQFGEAGVATGWHDSTTVALLDTYLKNKWGL